MMDESEMRELRETADCGCIKGMGLGKPFTVQLIPDLKSLSPLLGPVFPSRCTSSQRQDFVAIFGTSRNLEERILSLFTAPENCFSTSLSVRTLPDTHREDPVMEETCSTERVGGGAGLV